MAINPANVVSDFDSGKMYDVSDPAHPIEVTAKRNSDGSYTYNPVGGSTPSSTPINSTKASEVLRRNTIAPDDTSSGSIITKNTNTQTSGNGHYETDTETGKTYFVPDDNPAKPVNVTPKPAYDIDDTGKVTYNKDNTAGIPDIRQPTTVIKPTSDQVAAALGGVPITDSGTRATSLDIKLGNLNNELSALNKSFDNTWKPLIDQNNVFTGTDNQYLQYQQDLQLLESKQSEINKELDKNYIKLADGNYMPKSDYENLSQEFKFIAKKQGLNALDQHIKAFYKELPDGGLILKTDYWNLDQKYRDIADTKGYNAMSSQMDKDQKLQDEAFKKLESYKDADGNYNISQYLLDAKSPSEGLTTLRNAGFDNQTIVDTAKYNNDVANQNREAVAKAYNIPEIAKNVALDMIPIVGTVRYAQQASKDGNYSTGEKLATAGYAVMDIMTVVPIIGQLSAAARGTRSLAAGARALNVTKEAGRIALAEVKAPITMIAHPIQTIKAGLSPIETLLRPNKIPLSALEVKYNTVRLPTKAFSSDKEAMQVRDIVTSKAMSNKPAEVEIGNVKVKLEKAAVQKLAEPVIVHASPDIRPFLNGADIKDLYVAPDMHTRFAYADSHGNAPVDGIKGAILIRDQSAIDKLAGSNKTYKGTVEIEKVLDNYKLGKPVQTLITRDASGKAFPILVFGKKFTKSEVAKLKFMGSLDTVKQIFMSPAKINGKQVQDFNEIAKTDIQTEKLLKEAKTLKSQGKLTEALEKENQAKNLSRESERLRAEYSKRYSKGSLRIAALNYQDKAPLTRLDESTRINRPRGEARTVTRVADVRVPTRSTKTNNNRNSPIVRSFNNTNVRTSTNVRSTNTTKVNQPNVNIINPPDRIKPPDHIKPPDRIKPPTIKPPGRVRPPTFKKPPRARLTLSSTDSKKKSQREEFNGAITWKQGFGWWAIKAPYKSKSDVAFFYKNPPPNAREVKGGAGSALRSIQVLTGKAPNKLAIDLGIMDIVIDKGKVITFKRDIKQKRKGDIELKTSVSQVRQVRKKRKVGKNKDFWE